MPELQKEKRRLESNIDSALLSLINDFKEKTGISIDDISIKLMDARRLGGIDEVFESEYTIVKSKVEIKL